MPKEKKGAAPVVERGDDVGGTLFRGGRKAAARADLTRELAPTLARWLKAACLWDETAAIGDYRFLVFSIDVAPKVQVYVQFWSEPGEAVVWEVSSGRGNSPAEKWLAGERSQRIEAFGFEVGGQGGNFHREVDVHSAADVKRIARTAVDIFYTCFDYRGVQPIEGFMAYESRAELQLAYDGFTPADLMKILDGCGFEVDLVDDRDQAPVLRAARRGIETTITCVDRVPEEDVFLRAILTAELEVSPEVAAAAREAGAPISDDALDVMAFGTTLMFDGGVTVGWVVRRLEDWDAMTFAARREAGKGKAGKGKAPNGPVH